MKHGAAEFHFSARACVVRFDHESEVEIDELKPDSHKGYERVEEAVESLMRTILTVKLTNGKTRSFSFSEAAIRGSICHGPNAAMPARRCGSACPQRSVTQSRFWRKPTSLAFPSCCRSVTSA
jgi:hypothetical protein